MIAGGVLACRGLLRWSVLLSSRGLQARLVTELALTSAGKACVAACGQCDQWATGLMPDTPYQVAPPVSGWDCLLLFFLFAVHMFICPSCESAWIVI